MEPLQFDPSCVYLIIHQEMGLALEVPEIFESKNYSIETGPANENNHKQLWIFHSMGGGNFEIISAVPNRPLSIDGKGLGLGHGSGSNNQLWFIDSTVYNKVKIGSSKNKGQYLGIEEGRVKIRFNLPYESNDGWTFRKVENNEELNKTCFITDHQEKRIMETPIGKNKEGIAVSLTNPDYRFHQRFRIHRAGEVFVIKGLITALNLDIKHASEGEGVSVILWHSTGGTNQFWKFEERGDKVFRISSWMNPEIEIGFKGHHVVSHHGTKFLWKIHGYVPSA